MNAGPRAPRSRGRAAMSRPTVPTAAARFRLRGDPQHELGEVDARTGGRRQEPARSGLGRGAARSANAARMRKVAHLGTREPHGRTLVYTEESKLQGADVSAVAPDGRKMLRLEVRNAQTPIERKPEW